MRRSSGFCVKPSSSAGLSSRSGTGPSSTTPRRRWNRPGAGRPVREVRMSSLTPVPVRVACYARVSTEDQAERQTVAAQTDFLRRYCDLHGLPVAGVYVDDGISGATPLEDRPEGRRLLQDAESGAFTVVSVYRLDRLGRSLKAL